MKHECFLCGIECSGNLRIKVSPRVERTLCTPCFNYMNLISSEEAAAILKKRKV